MHRRLFVSTLAVAILIVACGRNPIPSATETPVSAISESVTQIPATQPAVSIDRLSQSESVTQIPATQPVVSTDWLSQLEVIQAGNWSRLQLLKTFPAEMPLNHSEVAISQDGKTMAVGSSSGAKILFFDLVSGQLSQAVSINGVSNADAYFQTMEYLPDETIIANSNSPYVIYHIDAAGNILSEWDGINFALSADKGIMAAYPTDQGIALVTISNGASLPSLNDVDARSLSFSPDGSKIAAEDTGVDFIQTTIWDVPSQTILTTLDEMANPQFSPDGRFLAVTDWAENTNPLKIFSPDGVTQLTTLSVNDPIGLTGTAPLFSHDGSIIASQIANGSPVAWDTTNWQMLDPSALQGELYSFSPDGRILITRTEDGGILLWGVSLK